MALFDITTAADALEDLLDRERIALMGGRFDVLERLSSEKERLFGAVVQNPGDAAQLVRLKDKAGRNRNLLAAMERGVRAATKRVQRLSEKPATLQTYDASGRLSPIAGSAHALQRRA